MYHSLLNFVYAGPWFRLTSCFGYVFDVQPDVRSSYFAAVRAGSAVEKPTLPPGPLIAAARSGIDAGMLLELPEDVSETALPALLQALGTCFRVPELRQLLSRLRSKCDSQNKDARRATGAVSAMSKQEVLQSIRSVLIAQRTLMGSAVAPGVFVRDVLLELDGPSLGLTKRAGFAPVIVRVNADVVVRNCIMVVGVLLLLLL